MDATLVRWAMRLQAIAQNGIAYAHNQYDIERYQGVKAIAAEMVAARTGASFDTVLNLFDGQAGYATPKVDVRAAIFEQDSILLVRESQDNRWTLPGGWADIHESPSEAIEREVLEESGFRVTARN